MRSFLQLAFREVGGNVLDGALGCEAHGTCVEGEYPAFEPLPEEVLAEP